MDPHNKRCASGFIGLLLYVGLLVWFYDYPRIPSALLLVGVIFSAVVFAFFIRAIREQNTLYVFSNKQEPPR